MDGAKRLGEKLVAEVEVEGLSSLLSSLRASITQDTEKKSFNIPALDALVTHQNPHQPTQQPSAPSAPAHRLNELWDPELPHPPAQPSISHHSAKDHGRSTQPLVVELISPPATHHPSGSGKTSLIYLITALAILPATLSSIVLDGQKAAVVIVDPLSHFCVSRLAEIMAEHIKHRLDLASSTFISLDTGQALDQDQGRGGRTDTSTSKSDIKTTIKRALQHVHIFRPQSWDSTLATLSALPIYLFDKTAHSSMRRRVHSIVLEDVDAFYWNIRASSSSSSSSSSTSYTPPEGVSSTSATSRTKTNPTQEASQTLTNILRTLSRTLSALVLTTSHSPSPFPSPSSFSTHPSTSSLKSYRAPFPTIWPLSTPITRLAIRRVEVLAFAPGMSAEESEAERGARWEVISRARFECWKLGGSGGSGGGEGKDAEAEGFVFRVGRGVSVEGEENKEGR
ncbi:hypothetical protein K491DRAFT_436952 [Lophiostoma macrostomum CBS 122681]|uniref:DNA recombination and repair protein Rad51-like C-terminal domain-containing protein n=1 Tax=Lophiostoma macrostomum CBS 122681 TaxID=1314788 RepID=A0A6A6T5K1_9PLEO|nr:hypothetical protein K491DRAFT_436952 [Lophiostoma macrostomum CBS 122681]